MMHSSSKFQDKIPSVIARPMYQDMILDSCFEINKNIIKKGSPPAPEKKIDDIEVKLPPVPVQKKTEDIKVKPPSVPEKKTDKIKVKPPPVSPEKTDEIKVKLPPVPTKKTDEIKVKPLPVPEKKIEEIKVKPPPAPPKKTDEIKTNSPPVPEKKIEVIKVEPPLVPEKKIDIVEIKPPPVPKTSDAKLSPIPKIEKMPSAPEKRTHANKIENNFASYTENCCKSNTCRGTILVEPSINRRNCLWITPVPASIFKDNLESIPKITKM